MEYLNRKIKKNLAAACTLIMAGAVICGCGINTPGGSKVIYCKETSHTAASSGNNASNIKEIKSEAKKADNQKKTEKKDKDLYKNVPVYGWNEKGKIKKYLASLPDSMSLKEAKKRGIVIETYKNQNQYEDIWQDFYKYVRKCEKKALKYETEVICRAEPDRAAIVILRYTTEGDACFTYISFIEGNYYVFEDSSRDKFKDPSWNGYSSIGTFKSLRKSEKTINCKEEKYSYRYVRYMAFKEQGISRKKINSIIKKDNTYNKQYCDIFSYHIAVNGF